MNPFRAGMAGILRRPGSPSCRCPAALARLIAGAQARTRRLAIETGLLAEWPGSGPPLAWKAGAWGPASRAWPSRATRSTRGRPGGAQHVIWPHRDGGKVRWTTEAAAPRDETAARARHAHRGRRSLYALGTEGDLVCLRAATGKERWRKNLVRDFGGAVMSSWKFSESPLVDGDRVMVTPGGPTRRMVALDKRTGRARSGAPRPSRLGRAARRGGLLRRS